MMQLSCEAMEAEEKGRGPRCVRLSQHSSAPPPAAPRAKPTALTKTCSLNPPGKRSETRATAALWLLHNAASWADSAFQLTHWNFCQGSHRLALRSECWHTHLTHRHWVPKKASGSRGEIRSKAWKGVSNAGVTPGPCPAESIHTAQQAGTSSSGRQRIKSQCWPQTPLSSACWNFKGRQSQPHRSPQGPAENYRPSTWSISGTRHRSACPASCVQNISPGNLGTARNPVCLVFLNKHRQHRNDWCKNLPATA